MEEVHTLEKVCFGQQMVEKLADLARPRRSVATGQTADNFAGTGRDGVADAGGTVLLAGVVEEPPLGLKPLPAPAPGCTGGLGSTSTWLQRGYCHTKGARCQRVRDWGWFRRRSSCPLRTRAPTPALPQCPPEPSPEKA